MAIYNPQTGKWENSPELPKLTVTNAQPKQTIKVTPLSDFQRKQTVKVTPFLNVPNASFLNKPKAPVKVKTSGFPISFSDIRDFINKPRPALAGFINAIKPKNTLTRFINELPRAGANQVVQPIFRSGASVVQTLARKPIFTPDSSSSRLERIIQDEMFGGASKDFSGVGQDFLSGVGADTLSKNKYATFAVGGALSIADFTGGKSASVKQLSKLDKVSDVVNTLKKMGVADDTIEVIAPKIAKTKDITKIEDILKSSQISKAADPLTTKARKYKSAEEFVKAQQPRVGGIAPELKEQTLYRGMSETEWKAIQEGGLSGKRPDGRTYLTTEKETAQMAVDEGIKSGKGKGVIVELKPEAGQKVISGGKIGENTGGNLRGEYQGKNIGIDDIARVTDSKGNVIYEATTGGKTKSQLTDIWNKANAKSTTDPLVAEARKYKSAEEFVNTTPKTVNVWRKSRFSDGGAMVDYPVIRKEDNITLYQGGDGGQHWTPDKKYAEQFGNVKEKTGSFYQIDNGNRMTNVYVEAPTKSQLTDIWKKANQANANVSAPLSRTEEIPAIEPNQSPLASLNLSRTVSKQPVIPTKNKVVSYDDSIIKPLVSKEEAKIASTIASLPKVKVAKNPGLVAGAENLKDISGFKAQTRDVYRNFKAFFGDSFPNVKKQILDPFDVAKGRYIDDQSTILTDLKKTIVDGLGIKKGSKESAAVMDYGEKLITKDDLVKKFGNDKANKIAQADEWFRAKYDSFLDEVNAIRKQIYPKSPEKIIPRRQDYYRHFQELSGLEGLKNVFETPAGIDPTLAGISAFTKPKSKFLSFAQRRLGLQSERDAVGGFLNYVPSYSYAKNIDPEIGKFRTLASDLSIQTQSSRNANNFIEYLNDFSNDLAGKTNAADRFVQKIIGRKAFDAINWLNQRVKANTILGNASTAVAQMFNVPQGVASAKLYSVPGAVKTMGSIFTKNKPMLSSTFIKERYSHSMFNVFEESMLAQPKRFASWVTGVFDEVGTKFIWNSHYTKAINQGIDNPIKYADDTTRALVAGRGVGEVPLLQKSKLVQLFAPFQLEVGNLWYVMGDMVKARDFSGIATLFVAGYLMNRVAEKVRGSDVSFDPINAVYEGIQALQQEEDKKKGAMKLGGRVAGEVLSNIPGGQTLAAMYPEYGFKGIGGLTREQLFGEGDPTRFGGGLLAVKGLQDPLFKVIPPFGGAQIKKTLQGASAFLKGRVTGTDDKVKFDIEQSPQNFLRSILFGKYATPEAKQFQDQENPQDIVEKPVTPEESRVRQIYDEAQRLKAEGKIEQAVELVNELPKPDQEIYKKIKSKELKKSKEEITPKVLDIYKQAQTLKAEGNMAQALKMVNELNPLEQAVYKDLKTKYKDARLEDLIDEGVKKPEKTKEKNFIQDILIYAKALGTDPVTAFKYILTDQKIRRVDNGAIIVERLPLAESQDIKSRQGAASSMKLDHTIPLQLGGDNSAENLKLVTEEEWASYTPIENKLAKLLKAGTISEKEARKLIKDFKSGKVSAESILQR